MKRVSAEEFEQLTGERGSVYFGPPAKRQPTRLCVTKSQMIGVLVGFVLG